MVLYSGINVEEIVALAADHDNDEETRVYLRSLGKDYFIIYKSYGQVMDDLAKIVSRVVH
jgi:hypothetical protein